MSGDLWPPFKDKFDGFRGTAGARGERGDGELGRLLKVSMLGIGVLEGRGPGSIGRAGNCFEKTDGEYTVLGELKSATLSECLLEPVAKGFNAGVEGSLSTSISSSSLIEGNVWLKSVKLRRDDMRGEEDVDDVGDGGPKLEAGISVCGDGAVELPGTGEAWLGEGINGEGSVCSGVRRGLGMSGTGECVVTEAAGVGGTEPGVVVGAEGSEGNCRSREMRFEITLVGDTAIPAFCKARMRSAMLPPGFRIGPSESSDSASLQRG